MRLCQALVFCQPPWTDSRIFSEARELKPVSPGTQHGLRLPSLQRGCPLLAIVDTDVRRRQSIKQVGHLDIFLSSLLNPRAGDPQEGGLQPTLSFLFGSSYGNLTGALKNRMVRWQW